MVVVPIALQTLSRAEMSAVLPEALAIYVAAMGYPRGTEAQRGPVWASHTLRPGWRAVGAVETRADGTAGPLRGIAYGYHGSPQQWWGGQVRSGVVGTHGDSARADELMADYFELTELHVSPDAQGRGLGGALLDTLLAGRDERRVLLSTPEVRDEANRAWRLYRRRGFTDVLRGFTFAGDPRPFAVLARELPL